MGPITTNARGGVIRESRRTRGLLKAPKHAHRPGGERCEEKGKGQKAAAITHGGVRQRGNRGGRQCGNRGGRLTLTYPPARPGRGPWASLFVRERVAWENTHQLLLAQNAKTSWHQPGGQETNTRGRTWAQPACPEGGTHSRRSSAYPYTHGAAETSNFPFRGFHSVRRGPHYPTSELHFSGPHSSFCLLPPSELTLSRHTG